MLRKMTLLIILSFSLSFMVFAELNTPHLKLDLPMFDLPYQIAAANTVGHGFFSSYANPSMAQSLALTHDLFSSVHFGIKAFYDHVPVPQTPGRIIYYGGTALLNLFMVYMPGGDGWLHEEFHRSVMTCFGINSFNGMNRFPIGAEIVSVSQINDSDLIRFKKESPADFIRMHVAGIEGQYMLVDSLQKDNFFYDQKLLHEISYWLMTLNSHLYVVQSSLPAFVDDITVEMNKVEADTASRDFTGIDMTAWVYDLFRPNEPYEARGIHPSGNGINRYRTTNDITAVEIKYLQLQGYLQILNYVSPMMFGIRSIPFGKSGFAGNFAMRHYLTSFGSDIMANVFLKYQQFNMVFMYHSYTNYAHYFPAIEAALIDFPLKLGKFGMYISPRILIGMQPASQEFKTGSPEFLGLLGLRVDFKVSKYFLPYLDFAVKTDGWVAGNEHLNAHANIKIGVSARF